MKILIIGIVASGKTTLAKRLSKESKIQHYEIDLIVYDIINNKKRTNQEQQNIIKNIIKNNCWIIEGTLRKNLYNLLNIADKVIYLDIPLNIRKKRIISRFLKQKIGIEKCNYKPTIKMLKNMYRWTNEFENNRKYLEMELLKYKNKLIILKSKKQIDNYNLNK